MTPFSMKFKKNYVFDYNDANFNAQLSLIFNAQLSLLKQYLIFENSVKLTFFSKNKFYDRRKSSLTKYYCIRSTSVFKNFLRSPLIWMFFSKTSYIKIEQIQQKYLGIVYNEPHISIEELLIMTKVLVSIANK